MKKATRKEIEEIAEGWYKRGQKLGGIYNNPHSDPKKKAKAFRLMTEMSVRLTKMGLLLQQKAPSGLKKGGIIAKLNSKPVKLIKL